MSKYVDNNGTFNHQKWQREQTLSEMKQPINENAGNDFQKQFEFKAEEFMEDYLMHFEQMVDEGKMKAQDFAKLDKMWTACKKTMEKMSDQLKKTSKQYL